MIALSDPGWLQGAFGPLVGMFDGVGLKKNFGKTVGMVCRPCQAAVMQSDVAYERWMKGAGPYYQERHNVQVHCSECGEDMALGLLTVHI